jgi:hypothetical protein
MAGPIRERRLLAAMANLRAPGPSVAGPWASADPKREEAAQSVALWTCDLPARETPMMGAAQAAGTPPQSGWQNHTASPATDFGRHSEPRTPIRRQTRDSTAPEMPTPGAARAADCPAAPECRAHRSACLDRPIRSGRESWLRRLRSWRPERFRHRLSSPPNYPAWMQRRRFRHLSLRASKSPNQSRRCSWALPPLQSG